MRRGFNGYSKVVVGRMWTKSTNADLLASAVWVKGYFNSIRIVVMVSESLSYLTAVGRGSYAASSKTGVILGFREAEGALSWLFACGLRV